MRPRAAERFHRAAHAAAGGSLRIHFLILKILIQSPIPVRIAPILVCKRRIMRIIKREISFCLRPPEAPRGGVVGLRRFLRRVEGSEPDPGLFPRVTDLSGESTPGAFPHASVSDLGLCGGCRGDVSNGGGGTSPSPHG